MNGQKSAGRVRCGPRRRQPGPDLPELIGTQQADVIVIGAGFTGLSTALHLREAGVDVAIVEAAEPGWGASGATTAR